MRMRRTISGSELGQSIIETLLMMPLLLTLLLNAANFAYYFLYLVNLTSSQRSGVEYAIMGGALDPSTYVGVMVIAAVLWREYFAYFVTALCTLLPVVSAHVRGGVVAVVPGPLQWAESRSVPCTIA